jgi:hypothetical protein
MIVDVFRAVRSFDLGGRLVLTGGGLQQGGFWTLD